MAFVPEISRRPRKRKGDRGRTRGQDLVLHPRRTLPLGLLGRPKAADGTLDHNQALTGDDLIAFVERELFPYLHGFKQRASGPNTIEYKIGEIFGEIQNKVRSGYNPERAAGQIGVTKETLEPYPIALPSQVEQQGVVETIKELESKTERLESIYQRKLAALDALKKSLLNEAFTGQL